MTGRTDKEIYEMGYVEALSWVCFKVERNRVEQLQNNKRK